MRLDGVTVVDFTHLLPGPYATQLLADMGAEVLKVEPATGDDARRLDVGGGAGTLFSLVNRGKQSVRLDLKADGAEEVLGRLFAEADVVVEQFRPEVADRLGIDYDSVTDHRPDVVYCSLSGYGQTGPLSDRVGHDLNYLATAGVLDMTRGGPDEAPTIPGVPVADMGGGVFAAMCVVSGLLARELGNRRGEYVDVSLTDVSLSLGQVLAAASLFGGDASPGETVLTGRYPCYDVYRGADGGHLTLAAIEPHFWRRLCVALDREDMIDAHLADDESTRAAVREVLEAEFERLPAGEWEDRLGDADVPASTVDPFEEALEHPQLRHRGMVLDDASVPRLGFPARTAGGLAEPEAPPPALGEHTGAVLDRLGFGDAERRRLREAGVTVE